jgi:hypothetical protein
MRRRDVGLMGLTERQKRERSRQPFPLFDVDIFDVALL